MKALSPHPAPTSPARSARHFFALAAFSICQSLAAATANLNPTQDTYVRNGTTAPNNWAGTSFGFETTLNVKDGDVGFNRRSLLKFDLAAINGTITGVKLKIHVATKEGGAVAVPVRLHEISDAWSETTTWNTAPSLGTVLHSVDITGTGWKEYTHGALTAHVAAQQSGDDIVSFALTGNGVNQQVTFDSGAATNIPVLEVTYTPVETHALFASEDAYLRNGTHQNSNYGTATPLEVKNGATDFNRRALLKFNLGTLTGTVVQARLRIYVSARENNATIPLTVAQVANDAWREYEAPGVTWSNQPATGATLATHAGISANGWTEFDVTGFVGTEIAGDRVVSFKLFDTSAVDRFLQLHSREGANKPQLVIDLVPSPVALQFSALGAYRDAHVRTDDNSTSSTNEADTAYGSATTLVAKGASGQQHETYLRFNLGTVYGTVQGALLKIYVNAKGSGTIPVDIYAVANDTWFEIDRTVDGDSWPGIDWNNRPAAGTHLGTIQVSSSGAYVSLPVASYVSTQNAAGDKFASFVLRTSSTNSSGVTFSSKEGSHAASLEIDWQPGLLAFPGAAGPGGASRGAYTTTSTPSVARVTNRNSSGAGSFRAAVDNTTPGIVVFDVGGQFLVDSEIKIGSHKTIIGESAPEPVTFRSTSGTTGGKRVAIHGSHVVITGLRLRPGIGVDEQAIFVAGADGNRPMQTDIIIANCSLSWSGDELAGGWGGVQRVTYQYNVMGEALEPAGTVQNKGFYMGSDREDVEDLAFVRNLVTTNAARFVGFKRAGSAVIAENILYNWGHGDGALIVYGNQPFGQTRFDVLDNVLSSGPWTVAKSATSRTFRFQQPGAYRVYGNVTPAGTDYVYEGSSYVVSSRAFPGSYTPTVAGEPAIQSVVLSNAGARLSGALDSIDDRVITLYLTNTATAVGPADGNNHSFFDDYEPTLGTAARADTDSDGIYDAYEAALGVSAGSLNPHTAIVAGDNLGSHWVGYMRIENQRHWLRTGSLQ